MLFHPWINSEGPKQQSTPHLSTVSSMFYFTIMYCFVRSCHKKIPSSPFLSFFCPVSVRYEKIKFLVIALKNAVEVYAWAPKPYHKFMAFKVCIIQENKFCRIQKSLILGVKEGGANLKRSVRLRAKLVKHLNLCILCVLRTTGLVENLTASHAQPWSRAQILSRAVSRLIWSSEA